VLAAQIEVGLERAGVAVQILGGPELQRVHEDRGDQVLGALAGLAQQAGVPLMQRAHGHDDGHSAGEAAPRGRQLVAFGGDDHALPLGHADASVW
jgi:hypothetical protein